MLGTSVLIFLITINLAECSIILKCLRSCGCFPVIEVPVREHENGAVRFVQNSPENDNIQNPVMQDQPRNIEHQELFEE